MFSSFGVYLITASQGRAASDSQAQADGMSLSAVNGAMSSMELFPCETKYFRRAWTALETSQYD